MNILSIRNINSTIIRKRQSFLDRIFKIFPSFIDDWMPIPKIWYNRQQSWLRWWRWYRNTTLQKFSGQSSRPKIYPLECHN